MNKKAKKPADNEAFGLLVRGFEKIQSVLYLRRSKDRQKCIVRWNDVGKRSQK